jgi:hypothetical protein
MELILDKSKELMSLYENMSENSDTTIDKTLRNIMLLHKNWLLEKESQQGSYKEMLSPTQGRINQKQKSSSVLPNLTNIKENEYESFPINNGSIIMLILFSLLKRKNGK